jgi:hypothetical protein
MPRGFPPLPTILALACRTMRVRTPVIARPTVAMCDARQERTLGGAVAVALIGHDAPWRRRHGLEELPEALLRGPCVTPPLSEDSQDVVVLIHDAPQVMACALPRQKDLIHVPGVSRSGTPVAPVMRGLLAPLPTPLPDRFVRDRESTCTQAFLSVTVAQGAVRGEPDLVADEVAGKAMLLVALAGGGRGHVWLPLRECAWSGRRHHQGHDVLWQEAGATR